MNTSHQRRLRPEDFFTHDFVQNPYPVYQQLRAQEGLFWLPQAVPKDSGIWLISRYADAQELLRNSELTSKNLRSIPRREFTLFDMNLLHRDGPEHLMLRRLVSDFFSVKGIKQVSPMIDSVVNLSIQKLKGRGGVDFVSEVSEQLPIEIMAKLIGIPMEDTSKILVWSKPLISGFDSFTNQPKDIELIKSYSNQLVDYVKGLLVSGRLLEKGTLIETMKTKEGYESISIDESAVMLAFLLFAGHETTGGLIGILVSLLAQYPSQLKLIRNNPEFVNSAVEEALRFDTPAQRTSFRVAQVPIEISGVTIKPGEQVAVLLGSINRDERIFERSEEFDVTRNPNRHLAFGYGSHNCLGQTLARIQAQSVLKSLLSFNSISLVNGTVSYKHNTFFRSLASLNVLFR